VCLRECVWVLLSFDGPKQMILLWPPCSGFALECQEHHLWYMCARIPEYACMDIKGRSLWTQLCAQPYLYVQDYLDLLKFLTQQRSNRTINLLQTILHFSFQAILNLSRQTTFKNPHNFSQWSKLYNVKSNFNPFSYDRNEKCNKTRFDWTFWSKNGILLGWPPG
jgi:hypothetical protein